MPRLVSMLLAAIFDWFRPRLAMQLDLIALRHPVTVYKQRIARPRLPAPDRLSPKTSAG